MTKAKNKRAKKHEAKALIALEKRVVSLHKPQVVKQKHKHRHSKLMLKHGIPEHAHMQVGKYLDCLMDPWYAGPIRLGWGSFTPTMLRTGFSRFTATVNAADANFAMVLHPDTIGNSGAAVPSTYVQWGDPTTTTALNAALRSLGGGYGNATALSSVIQTLRVVAASIRVTVRYSANTVRGDLIGLYIPGDSFNNLTNSTFSALANLNGARWATSDVAGQISIQVNYRPSDVNSFAFTGTAVSATTTIIPHLIVVGAGWIPNTFSVDVAFLSHYESLGGFDPAADDYDASETIAASGATMDQVGALASTSQPILTDNTAIMSIDNALANITRSSQRTGMSTRSSFMSQPNTIPQGNVMQPTSGSMEPLSNFGKACSSNCMTPCVRVDPERDAKIAELEQTLRMLKVEQD